MYVCFDWTGDLRERTQSGSVLGGYTELVVDVLVKSADLEERVTDRRHFVGTNPLHRRHRLKQSQHHLAD